jgi:hypothetical protein
MCLYLLIGLIILNLQMARGHQLLTSHQTQVDCTGNIILGLPSNVFKNMIFLNMCKGMDNCALLESFNGCRLVSKGWKEMSSTNVIWRVFQMLQRLIGPMVRT